MAKFIEGSRDDNEAAEVFYNNKAELEALEKAVKANREDLLVRIEQRGEITEVSEYTGQATKKFLNTGKYKAVAEGRKKIEVINQQAVLIFKDKGWDDDIKIISTIALREGVDPRSIPVEIVQQIKKFFDITSEKYVDKEAIFAKKQEKLLTDAEVKSCLKEDISFALKVQKI